MKTGIVTTDTYKDHLVFEGHPENADRVTSIIEKLQLKKKKFIWKKPKKFDLKLIENTHGKKFTDTVFNSFPSEGIKFLDSDTPVVKGSEKAAIDAVGSIIEAIDGVESKSFKNASCIIRPPGHHSGKTPAGFCIFNNIAVGGNYLINNYKL